MENKYLEKLAEDSEYKDDHGTIYRGARASGRGLLTNLGGQVAGAAAGGLAGLAIAGKNAVRKGIQVGGRVLPLDAMVGAGATLGGVAGTLHGIGKSVRNQIAETHTKSASDNQYLAKVAEEDYDMSYPSHPITKGIRSLGSGVAYGTLGAVTGAAAAPLLLGKRMAGKAVAQRAASAVGAKSLGVLGGLYGVGKSVKNQILHDQQRMYKEAGEDAGEYKDDHGTAYRGIRAFGRGALHGLAGGVIGGIAGGTLGGKRGMRTGLVLGELAGTIHGAGKSVRNQIAETHMKSASDNQYLAKIAESDAGDKRYYISAPRMMGRGILTGLGGQLAGGVLGGAVAGRPGALIGAGVGTVAGAVHGAKSSLKNQLKEQGFGSEGDVVK